MMIKCLGLVICPKGTVSQGVQPLFFGSKKTLPRPQMNRLPLFVIFTKIFNFKIQILHVRTVNDYADTEI